MTREFPYNLPFEEQIAYLTELHCQTSESKEEVKRRMALKSRILELKKELDGELKPLEYEALKNTIIPQHWLLKDKNVIILNSLHLVLGFEYFYVDSGKCSEIEFSSPMTKKGVKRFEKDMAYITGINKEEADDLLRDLEDISSGQPKLLIRPNYLAKLYPHNWEWDMENRLLGCSEHYIEEGLVVYKVEKGNLADILANTLNKVYRK